MSNEVKNYKAVALEVDGSLQTNHQNEDTTEISHASSSGEIISKYPKYNATVGSIPKSGAYTLAVADSGQVVFVSATAIITLPATVVGMVVIISNSSKDGVGQISISPAAADKIIGGGNAGVDNKDVINILATAKNGDFIKLIGDGVLGWYVAEKVGIWVAEG